MKSELIHFVSEHQNIPKVLNLFQTNFLKNFKKISTTDNEPIFTALPYMYRLWYYSVLINNSVVTPASFINSQVERQFGKEHMVIPIIKPILSKSTITGFDFNYRVFSCHDHPVLRDLFIFLNDSSPVIQLDENNVIIESVRKNLKKHLTFSEDNYITFLTRICFRLNIFKKLPSINTNLAQVMPVAMSNFIKLPKVIQLKNIVDVILTDASETLIKTFPFEKNLFTLENISKIFSNSSNMGDFFQKYFAYLGIDINELIDDLAVVLDSEAPDETTASSLSFYFTLNSLMDSMIFTPLGYYLQLIQPIYTEKYDFNFKMQEIIRGHYSKQIPLESYFFESCASFDITPLGKRIFLHGNNIKSHQQFEDDTDFNKVFESIMKWDSNYELNIFFDMLKLFDERKHVFK